MKRIKFSLNTRQAKKNGYDRLFCLFLFLVTLYGTLMVFSAGSAFAETRYDDRFYFVKKQTLWILIGLVVILVTSKIDPSVFQKYTIHLYIATLCLLALVLAVGFVGNGAKRWISIGPLTIQPSEIAKLTMIMMPITAMAIIANVPII
jgi:cell division protein FtsW